MARRALHGLVLEHRCAAGVDPAELLLGHVAAAAPGAPAGLVIETEVVAARTRPEGPPDQTFQGAELRLREGGALRVDTSLATVTRRAEHLRIEVPAPLDEAQAWAVAHLPLLLALSAVLRERGLHHLHAGAVVDPGGRVLLLPGPSGCGKSTLVAALVAAGCAYLGDDVVLLAAGPRVLALPRAFHLAPRSAAAIPGAPAVPSDRTTALGKLALDPRALFPGRERHEAGAPAALVFPRVADRDDTALHPLSPAAALGRLAESSALVAVGALPGVRAHLALLGAVADGARTFEADLGRDLLANPVRTAGRVLGQALP
ncbi:MAG: hypothetical protein QM704_03905 [Anaeromyxobacteraceae bacterium]